MVDARVSLSEYSNRVIAVVKAKHALQPEVKESYVKKLLEIEKKHFKKYEHKHTSLKDLRKEVEGE